jgi:hypothetical protein
MSRGAGEEVDHMLRLISAPGEASAVFALVNYLNLTMH